MSLFSEIWLRVVVIHIIDSGVSQIVNIIILYNCFILLFVSMHFASSKLQQIGIRT